MTVFPPSTRETFARHYPEQPCILTHDLHSHELLTLDSLADLAGKLPGKSIECFSSDQPIGVDGAAPENTGRSPADTILHIAEAKSWVNLRNIEQHPAYRALLLQLLEELRPGIESCTGRMLTPQGFIFVTSAGGTTPYHFDPEHNILIQLRGSKTMTQFPAGDPRFAADERHESYHRGSKAELPWDDGMELGGTKWKLAPGKALFVPVMAPHYVKNGPDVSVSLSITWRSEWSYAEADARAFNGLLRRYGISPKPPNRWPARNTGKAIAWRLARRMPGID